MKKKVFTSLMIMTMLTTQIAPVYADYSTAGDTGSQDVTSSFDVSADDFGGVIVSIPNDIPLSYSKDTGTYSGQDSVKVSGYLDSDLRIKVAVPSTIDFSNADSKLTGDVSFGTDGVGYWSSDECKSGVVQKELAITVSDLSDIHTGHYAGAMTVNISVESAADSTYSLDNLEITDGSAVSGSSISLDSLVDSKSERKM